VAIETHRLTSDNGADEFNAPGRPRFPPSLSPDRQRAGFPHRPLGLHGGLASMISGKRRRSSSRSRAGGGASRGTGRRFAGKVCPSYARTVVSCAISLSLSLSLAGRTDKGRLRHRTAAGLNERTWSGRTGNEPVPMSLFRATPLAHVRVLAVAAPFRFCSLMTVRH